MKGEPVNIWTHNHPYCDDIPCEECHEQHQENGDVIKFAIQGLPCCGDTVDDALKEGKICKTHMVWLWNIKDKWWCDECGEADAKYNGHPKPK